jgi:hypothetical protein
MTGVPGPVDGGGGEAPAVAVTLSAGPGPHRVGVPVPVRVEVRNVGTVPVRMPGVLDGSETGTRLPHYRPAVLRGDEVVAAPPGAEDPLVGPVRPEDLARLGPGEAFDPTDRSASGAFLPLSTFTSYRPDRPGRYRFTLDVDTTGAEDRWMGRFGQEPHRAQVAPLLADVPQVALTATVDVDVE